MPGAQWVPVPAVLSCIQPCAWQGTDTKLLSRGGWLTPATPLMGKLRHEEVKANISKHETLQALFSVTPRCCRSWWVFRRDQGPSVLPKRETRSIQVRVQNPWPGGTNGAKMLYSGTLSVPRALTGLTPCRETSVSTDGAQTMTGPPKIKSFPGEKCQRK